MEAVSSEVKEYSAIWMQAATCTGCSVSVLNSQAPSIKNVLLDEILPGRHINLRFQATIMAGQGNPVLRVLEETMAEKPGQYLLVIEGAIPGYGFGSLGEAPMRDRAARLARHALAVVALGTCASYGGIAAAVPNPSKAVSVRELLKKEGITTPLVNIPGCPPHPDWLVGTIACILLYGLPGAESLDDFGRPLLFYRQLIHEHCPRRAAFNEGKFAKKPGDPGCLYELGCKGPITYADCPTRMWNGGVNWCVGSGAPCNGCTQPEFPDLIGPLYEKVTDIDIPVIGAYWRERGGGR